MNPLAVDGYQVVRGVLSVDDVQSMRGAISETIDRVAGALRAPVSMSHPEVPLEDRFDRIFQHDRAYATALFRAALADAQRDPRIEAIAGHSDLSQVVADTLLPLGRTGQVIRTRASVPVFAAARSQWHQDVLNPAHDGNSCGSVRLACWIPLTDVDESNGALELIPGDWREPLPHVGNPDGRFHIPDEHVPDRPRVTVPLQRGDVVILDRFIPHRTLPVQQNSGRWTVVMWVKAKLPDAS